jgi:hypothetical protein
LFAWWNQAILYGIHYVHRIGAEAFLGKSFRKSIAFGLIFAWLLILICISWRTRRENGRAYAFLVCWLLSAFAGVAIGRRYYANYFIQIMPPLSLLGAVGLTHLLKIRHQQRFCLAGRVCCAAFIISFVWFHSRTLANWCSFAYPEIHRMRLWTMGKENKTNLEVARHLSRRSSPQDRIFVWGAKPQLFFLAQRAMATIWSDFDVADDWPPRSAEPLTQAHTVEILEITRPRYIVDVQTRARIVQFPHFRALVEKSYEFDLQIGGVRLYRLRQAELRDDVQDEAENYGAAADSETKAFGSNGVFR